MSTPTQRPASNSESRKRHSSTQPTYGFCTACRSVEVRLNNPTGIRDLSNIGESAAYPTGYGCEVCA